MRENQGVEAVLYLDYGFICRSGNICRIMNMKKRIPNKEILPKVEYVHMEPKNEEEREKQNNGLDKAFDILFNATLEKRRESEVAKGETQETFFAYSTKDKRKQMRWFVNKLITLCDNPCNISTQDNYSEYLHFEIDSLIKSQLFPFGIRTVAKMNTVANRNSYTNFARKMLREIKRNIYKLKEMGFNFNTDHFTWYDIFGKEVVENQYYANHEGADIYIDIYFRPLFEAYLVFMDSNERAIENGKEKPRVSIEKIEVLEDKTEQKAITIYINGDYKQPKEFSRGILWGKLYELAKNKMIDKDKNVVGYFNSNPANPLYTPKGGFMSSSVLKDKEGYIVPNIEIDLITKEKVSRRLNSLN